MIRLRRVDERDEPVKGLLTAVAHVDAFLARAVGTAARTIVAHPPTRLGAEPTRRAANKPSVMSWAS